MDIACYLKPQGLAQPVESLLLKYLADREVTVSILLNALGVRLS